jgi:chemotaxis protein methyltransferase CheR
MPIAAADFDYLCRLVMERSAIVLEPGKEYLADSRLLPVARRAGCDTIGTLIARLRSTSYGDLHRQAVEAMTTNETLFFRDAHPFETFQTMVLPGLIASRASERRINILCAPCSSGQEPYSLAMLIRERFPQLASWSLRLMAADLSTEMLARAKAGRYSQLEVNRGLPAPYLVKYFRRQGVEWEISDEIRRMVELFPMNLAGQWPILPPLDIIFMRNVLIYFDLETKKSILSKVRRVLRPDGYLVLGGAETTFNRDESFERLTAGTAGWYRLRHK